MITCKVDFDTDKFEKDIHKQIEEKIRKVLSGVAFKDLKVTFDWSKTEGVQLSGPEDQIAAAQIALKKHFGK